MAFVKKLTDKLVSKVLNNPCVIPLDRYIDFLKDISNSLVLDNCYPDSIFIDTEYASHEYETDRFIITGYRPENETERSKRLKNEKAVKENKAKLRQTDKEKRYKNYLKLKDEFETNKQGV
jgi:hypothetical protein